MLTHRKILEHIIILLFVGMIMLSLSFILDMNKKQSANLYEKSTVGKILAQDFVDIKDPFHRALLKDISTIYFSDNEALQDSIQNGIGKEREAALYKRLQESSREKKLTITALFSILGMYIKFLFTFCIVLAITYYGVVTLGSYMFIKSQQEKFNRNHSKPTDKVKSISLKILKYCFVFITFCPAYVLAYSVKTEFSTAGIIFMIILSVGSNGLLFTYANKFLAFLKSESRKGYVATAVVKNVNSNYENSDLGIKIKDIFKLRKHFKNHIFDTIYKNAHYQYISTLKEQAAFLITGLIIIEMALNMHGFLSYEMLRQLLYENYSIVLLIVFLIFFTVKIVDIIADFLRLVQEKELDSIKVIQSNLKSS